MAHFFGVRTRFVAKKKTPNDTWATGTPEQRVKLEVEAEPSERANPGRPRETALTP